MNLTYIGDKIHLFKRKYLFDLPKSTIPLYFIIAAAVIIIIII